MKWEYCVLIGVKINAGGVDGSYPRIVYLSENGISKEIYLGNKEANNRPEGWKKVSEGGYIAHWIATLGLQGWEMVSAVPTEASSAVTNPHSIYFKRLIS